MARQLWMADVLRAAGLTVHEYDGWKTRGLESFGPVLGVVCHGTGGSLKSTDSGETRTIAITGTPSAPTVPISQLYLSRSGQWWVIASGTATGVKTGTGGPLRGYSDDAVLQIEAQHHPTEPWTAVQYRSYVVGVAALVRHLGLAVELVIGHSEHQPGEKTDPWFDMNQFRRDVTAVLEGDDMDQDRANNIIASDARVRALFNNDPEVEYYIPGEAGPRKERNELHFALAERATAPVEIDYDALAAAMLRAGAATRADVRDAVGDGLEGGASAVRTAD